jgi:serpin B
MSDWELLQSYVHDGSADAMCELVNRHIAMVHATALRQARDPHTADDITQAVFLILMRRAKDLSPKVILSGWLFKTTLYAAADARNKLATRQRHEREASRMDMSLDTQIPDIARETEHLLNAAIDRLSPADRDAVVLRYLQGQTTAEVAIALGTTESTARQRLSRALDRLRKHLARMGILTAAAALVTLLDSQTAHATPMHLLQHIQGVARGSAAPTALSQSFAQGALRMIRTTTIIRNIFITGAAAAAIMAICIPLAISQTPAPLSHMAAVSTLPSVPPAPADVQAIAPADAERTAVDANTAFATDLYQVMLKGNSSQNLFISPYSISTVLGLTAAGARGSTADQMKKTLHISNTDAINVGLEQLAGELSDTQDGRRPYQLSVANALWDSDLYPMTPSFTATAAKYYGTSGVYPVNFRADPEAARARINKWVEDKTQAKIQNLLPDGSVKKDTALVLTNAIYFKAAWQTPFAAGLTRAQPFHVSPQQDAQVSLMSKGGNWMYFENDDLQAVSLPYQSVADPTGTAKSTSMLIILPKKADGLADLEQKITPENLKQWRAGMALNMGLVLLPKFTITSFAKLNDTLTSMGMTNAFDPVAADFNDLAIEPPGENLYIGAVYHKAFVDVDETGTEAAAATAVLGRGGGGRPIYEFTFRADHPFFFAIQYDPTGSILFMGHVIEPSPPTEANAAANATPGALTRAPVANVPAIPLKQPRIAAAAAQELAKATLADVDFVSPNSHQRLYQNLQAINTAAQAILDDSATDPAKTTTLDNNLARALAVAATRTNDIASRPAETQANKEKSTQLGAKLQSIRNQ